MDSDASDASVFGPRRLELEDCERMLRQSGPSANVPLLRAWPLAPVSSTPPATALGHDEFELGAARVRVAHVRVEAVHHHADLLVRFDPVHAVILNAAERFIRFGSMIGKLS